MRRLLSKGKGKGSAETTDAKQQMLAGRGRRSQVAIDGLVALLAFGKDSTDGFGLAKGVLGGLLYVIEMARVRRVTKYACVVILKSCYSFSTRTSRSGLPSHPSSAAFTTMWLVQRGALIQRSRMISQMICGSCSSGSPRS